MDFECRYQIQWISLQHFEVIFKWIIIKWEQPWSVAIRTRWHGMPSRIFMRKKIGSKKTKVQSFEVRCLNLNWQRVIISKILYFECNCYKGNITKTKETLKHDEHSKYRDYNKQYLHSNYEKKKRFLILNDITYRKNTYQNKSYNNLWLCINAVLKVSSAQPSNHC